MIKNATVMAKGALRAAILLGAGLLGVGCAAAPPEFRIDGVVVPSWWPDVAEKGGLAGAGPSQAQVCLALSKKLWERDILESLRYLRKGAGLRDPECCRQYLLHAEEPSVNQSQRVYARLFIEGLLRQGPLQNDHGEDLRTGLYEQLAWAWRTTEPCSPGKARQILSALQDLGGGKDRTVSPGVTRLLRDLGLRSEGEGKRSLSPSDVQLYAGESAEAPRGWLQIPMPPKARQTAEWMVSEAGAWGGGSDRLLRSANVLAFVVNDQGEPCFRGTRLWICNLGETPVYLSSLPVGQSNRELVPGREELLPLVASPLSKAETTTGIPLVIRHHRILR